MEPPWLQLRSREEKLKEVDGVSISPTVAVTTLFLVISYIALLAAPSPFVFASVTNLCYLAAGFWREAVSSAYRHSATLLVGQMAGGSLILVFMGASSLAYHRESTVNSPAHTLDILFGWLLVSHVFYVSFSVVVLAVVRFALPKSDTQVTTPMRVVRSALSILFLVFITLLMTFYDNFYANQQLFYFTTGPMAAVFGGVCRFLLVYEEDKLDWPAVGWAVVEMVVALTAVLAAILSQGELLGRTLVRATMPEEYDFYHGQWHFLLALVVALLYSRAADAARVVQGTHLVIVHLPLLDLVAEGLLFVYALLCIVFKEGQVDLGIAKSVLGSISGLFVVHGLVTLRVGAMGLWGSSSSNPRSLRVGIAVSDKLPLLSFTPS